jgi:hypothetical protein
MPVNTWIKHAFQGDDLLGGILNLYVLLNFSSGGILSVHLAAVTLQEDPEPFCGQDVGEAMELEAARWMNPEYQLEMLGVPLDEYLEGDLSDVDDDAGDYLDFLGGESLEEYYEHS